MDFLRAKMPRAERAGFVPPSPVSPKLFPHQRDICEWTCRGGRRAVFANFGMGKTRMHLQQARWVHEATGGRYLIVAPLGVRQEFTQVDGPAMGMHLEYVRTNEEVLAARSPYLITNYERVRDGNITLEHFAGAGLDEASVLRSFGSKTYQEFLDLFAEVPFRFVYTATPSPNRYKELIHYAAFLGVMDSGEALTRFFQRNSENAKDSSKMGAGMPEYVLVFRKLPSELDNAYADVPVTKSKAEYTRADWQIDAAGLWRSDGDRLPDPEMMMGMNMEELKAMWMRYSLRGGYTHEEHVALAKALEERGKLPSSFMLFPPVSRHKDIWTDIARMRTLNTEQSRRGEEKHVCPLQLDIIKRLITRYTNEGETVYDPFMGIGSVAYQALKMKRHALGTELNEEYWRFSIGYAEQVEAELEVPTLFDLTREEMRRAA
ncbi:MAG: hypothetical protein KCHDKBKB_03022 [Elusimicrobia bacterium]|nr:hypothetical protein [Elusimicrobiota bacterium]